MAGPGLRFPCSELGRSISLDVKKPAVGAMNATALLQQLEDDVFCNVDSVDVAVPRGPMVQLPCEICPGLTQEHFMKERKSFILKMLVRDSKTVFRHQQEFTDFVTTCAKERCFRGMACASRL